MRTWCATMLAAAASAQAPAPPANEALEQRVDRIEKEVQRLRLQADDGEDAPALAAAPAPSPNVLNPTLTVVGNGLYRWDDRVVLSEDGRRIDKRFWIREAELDMRAAVDPFADGVVIVALEAESPAEYGVDLEEAYVTVKSLPLPVLERPPLGLKLRAGRFLTETGNVNRLHTHDLPWPYRPLVVEEFLGEEGYHGDGASAQVFLPSFDADSAIELTAQILTGGGSRITENGTNSPGIVANLRWFRAFAGAHQVMLAYIFHEGTTVAGGSQRAFVGSVDGFYRYRPLRGGESRSFVMGGQFFLARLGEQADVPRGWFAFAQVQPWRPIYLGGRYDDTETLDASARRRSASGYLSGYFSEFFRLRGGYEHRFGDAVGEDGRDSVYVDLSFVIGAHPPEPFWVNK